MAAADSSMQSVPPGGKAAPVSLGVIRTDLTQTIPVAAAASQMLPKIRGMAISVEPAGG